MTVVVLARSVVHAEEVIAALLRECLEGKSDREGEALQLAREWGIKQPPILAGFAEARLLRRNFGDIGKRAEKISEGLAAAGQELLKAQTAEKAQPAGEPKPKSELDKLRARSAGISRVEEERAAKERAAQSKVEELLRETGAGAAINFHPSDFQQTKEPPTIEDRQRALEELADLRKTDPLTYEGKKKEWAKKLCTTMGALDKAVKRIKVVDDGEQGQATKIIAVGMGENVLRWHSPDGEAYASVVVNPTGQEGGGHWENYKIESRDFERWIKREYGNRHMVKNEGQWVQHVPGSGAVRDAISQLEGIAQGSPIERVPAFRVGGNHEVIWIDLGGPDWKTVRVTAGGWWITPGPKEVAFIRTGSMQAFPEPVRGGDIKNLGRVLNVRTGELVLVAGWLLQAFNPVGPYPLLNPHGRSEAGKTTVSRLVLKLFDPKSKGLRRPSRKVDDLLIQARNGWGMALDNVSWMTGDYSDALCTLSTGIATGTRAHYTNDEEHAYDVMRPVIFNGIPPDLVGKPDLASRTIKLEILPILKRRTEFDLNEEFGRIWPGVFGALLDGLQGALAGKAGIDVESLGLKPARMMDFEQFAEAGCRAMGFKPWEFVRAYSANRHGSMVAAAEASAVGRAVIAYMTIRLNNHLGYPKEHPSPDFGGTMTKLLQTLNGFRGDTRDRDWPCDVTRLSSHLTRASTALDALGIECLLRHDRRGEGGTQIDVVLHWTQTAIDQRKAELIAEKQRKAERAAQNANSAPEV